MQGDQTLRYLRNVLDACREGWYVALVREKREREEGERRGREKERERREGETRGREKREGDGFSYAHVVIRSLGTQRCTGRSSGRWAASPPPSQIQSARTCKSSRIGIYVLYSVSFPSPSSAPSPAHPRRVKVPSSFPFSPSFVVCFVWQGIRKFWRIVCTKLPRKATAHPPGPHPPSSLQCRLRPPQFLLLGDY